MRSIAALYVLCYFFLLGWATRHYGWDELAARKAAEWYRAAVREAVTVADAERARRRTLEAGSG